MQDLINRLARTEWPSFVVRITRSAVLPIFAGSETDEPPYFWTMIPTATHSSVPNR
jgi:hypothetical protein